MAYSQLFTCCTDLYLYLMPSLALYYYTKLFLKTIWLEVEMALVQFFNSFNYELGLLIAEHKRLKPLNMNRNKYYFL